jgi:uncharacterized protein YceK
MSSRAAALLVVLAATLVSGCGTVCSIYNTSCPGNKLEPYDGVKEALDPLSYLKSPDWNAWDRRELSQVFDAFGTFLYVGIDVPFSFVADTLLLPFSFGPPTHEVAPIQRSSNGTP